MGSGIRVQMMIRRHRQFALLGLLVLVAVIMLIIRVKEGLIGAAGAAPPRSLQSVEVSGGADGQSQERGLVRFSGPLTLRRDLFAWEAILPPSGGEPRIGARTIQQEAAETIHLQAIVVRGRWAQAIINGQVKRPGEFVDGFRIQRIEEHRIVVEKDAVEVEIEF